LISTEVTTTTSSPPVAVIETKPINESPNPEVIEIQPTKPVVEQTLPPPVVVSSVVEVLSEPVPVTKKPKKKKNKASTPNPLPLTVQAITAITPEPPKVILSSKVEVVEDKKENNKFIVEPVKQDSSVVEEVSEADEGDEDSEIVLQDGNAISEPEYDFLSRQPTEFVEETYRVVNLKPSVLKKPKAASKTVLKNVDTNHPTGLVTKSGGTVVNNGLTTVHETSVIGTYISGKYAQVLQSTSQIFNANQKPKIQPSSTLRILKTAAPSLNKTPKYVSNEEDLPAEPQGGSNTVKTSRRPGQSANSFKNRFRNREDVVEEIVTPSPPVYAVGKKSSSSRRSGSGKNKR
jgi:Putative sperm flagellar membrane protein